MAYIALIRGINVGRAKRVAMADLRKLIEELGYREVRSVLNSGNIVFSADGVEPNAAAAAIEEQGGEAIAVPTHTGDPESVKALVARTVERFGSVDILVNNAATNPHFGPFLHATDEQWDKTFDVNVKGYFRLIQAVVPHMQKQGRGRVINVASIAGLQAQPGMGVYSCSKAAVVMMTRALAVELGATGITVNAIAPGFVKTKFSSVLWQTP